MECVGMMDGDDLLPLFWTSAHRLQTSSACRGWFRILGSAEGQHEVEHCHEEFLWYVLRKPVWSCCTSLLFAVLVQFAFSCLAAHYLCLQALLFWKPCAGAGSSAVQPEDAFAMLFGLASTIDILQCASSQHPDRSHVVITRTVGQAKSADRIGSETCM